MLALQSGKILILPRVGCDLGTSKWESPHLSAWFLCIPCALATSNLIYITLTENHVGAPNTIWEDLTSTRIGCDLGGSKCESPPPICLVPCHPVHIGDIPNLVYQTLIKKHVGTPIWEDSIRVSCDSGGSKCESPHLSAWFPAIPCTHLIYYPYQETCWRTNLGRS